MKEILVAGGSAKYSLQKSFHLEKLEFFSLNEQIKKLLSLFSVETKPKTKNFKPVFLETFAWETKTRKAGYCSNSTEYSDHRQRIQSSSPFVYRPPH